MRVYTIIGLCTNSPGRHLKQLYRHRRFALYGPHCLRPSYIVDGRLSMHKKPEAHRIPDADRDDRMLLRVFT